MLPYLEGYDLSKYIILHCVIREKYLIDETYMMNTDIPYDTLFRTRCMLTHTAIDSLLQVDTTDYTPFISIDECKKSIQMYKIFSFMIGCEHVDHIFLCVRHETKWIYVASYAGEYSIQMKEIDMNLLLSWIKKISLSGIDSQWIHMFSCSKGCNSSCNPEIEIYGRKEIDIENIQLKIDTLQREYEESLVDENSYIYSDEYLSLCSM